MTWEGQGAGELPTDGTDMVSRSIAHAARVGGGIVPAFALHGVNRIPLERGLGSSAAACVAGITLADRLLDLGLEPEEVLELAVEIEGHPDNAAAAIAGGFTLAFGDGVIRLDPHPDLAPVAFVPIDIRLPTGEARAALPPLVPLGRRGLQRRTRRRDRRGADVRTGAAHADLGRSPAPAGAPAAWSRA